MLSQRNPHLAFFPIPPSSPCQSRLRIFKSSSSRPREKSGWHSTSDDMSARCQQRQTFGFYQRHAVLLHKKFTEPRLRRACLSTVRCACHFLPSQELLDAIKKSLYKPLIVCPGYKRILTYAIGQIMGNCSRRETQTTANAVHQLNKYDNHRIFSKTGIAANTSPTTSGFVSLFKTQKRQAKCNTTHFPNAVAGFTCIPTYAT